VSFGWQVIVFGGAGEGADLSQPFPVDGLDLWPLLTEGKSPGRDAILIVGNLERYAIRMGDWKLLVNPFHVGKAIDPETDNAHAAASSDKVELYNLADDISETKNLAAAQPDRVKRMSERLNAMMKGAVPSLAKGRPHDDIP
jgi:arylsulfatase I/J